MKKLLNWIKWQYRMWRISHLRTGYFTQDEMDSMIKALAAQKKENGK